MARVICIYMSCGRLRAVLLLQCCNKIPEDIGLTYILKSAQLLCFAEQGGKAGRCMMPLPGSVRCMKRPVFTQGTSFSKNYGL
jgi:hypothetical protein